MSMLYAITLYDYFKKKYPLTENILFLASRNIKMFVF